MSDAVQDQDIDPHEGPTEHEARHYQQTTGCHKDGCSLGRSQADTDWESLMAGVYYADQNFVLENSSHRFAAPDQATFDAVLAAIRPSPSHAINTIARGWENISEDLVSFQERHEYNMGQLSQYWEGDDFDSFEETNGELKKLVLETVDKIDEVATELHNAGSAIWTQQGGDTGQIPFPEPQYYIKNGGCGEATIHFRPPWHSGDCEIMNDEQAAFWYGGGAADGGTGDQGWADEMFVSANEWREGRVQYLMGQGMEQAEAQGIADSELDDWIFYEREDVANALVSASERTADDISTRKINSESEVNQTAYNSTPGSPPAITDPGDLEQTPDLSTPGGGSPGGLGSGDFGGGAPSDISSDLGGLDSPPGGGGFGGGGFGGSPGGLPDYSGGGSGLDDDNPWSSGITDPDDISGGLAGGGPGGLGGGLGGGSGIGGGPGGGLGSGLGGGAGAGGLGGGVGGGMVGAGGMGRGGGAGAGAGAGGRGGTKSGGMKGGGMGAGGGRGGGAGAGGRGMSGGMMGGGGGARGMGANENENSQDTWLVEEDDVWGIGNAEDDPYA